MLRASCSTCRWFQRKCSFMDEGECFMPKHSLSNLGRYRHAVFPGDWCFDWTDPAEMKVDYDRAMSANIERFRKFRKSRRLQRVWGLLKKLLEVV